MSNSDKATRRARGALETAIAGVVVGAIWIVSILIDAVDELDDSCECGKRR